MNKIITLLFILFTSLYSYSQVKYPFIQKSLDGKTIEYVFSSEQANKVNNTIDILNALDSIVANFEIKDSAMVKIIDNNGNVLSNLKLIIDNDRKIIANRNETIRILLDDADKYVKQIKKQDATIITQKKKIENMNTALWISIPIAIGSLILNVFLLK